MGFDFSIVKWIKISYSPPTEVVKLDDWFGWHVQNPYQTNMMIAGWDKDVGPSLYYLDYIATLHKLEKGGLGYGESDFMLWNQTKLVHQLCSLLFDMKSLLYNVRRITGV